MQLEALEEVPVEQDKYNQFIYQGQPLPRSREAKASISNAWERGPKGPRPEQTIVARKWPPALPAAGTSRAWREYSGSWPTSPGSACCVLFMNLFRERFPLARLMKRERPSNVPAHPFFRRLARPSVCLLDGVPFARREKRKRRALPLTTDTPSHQQRPRRSMGTRMIAQTYSSLPGPGAQPGPGRQGTGPGPAGSHRLPRHSSGAPGPAAESRP